MKIIVTGFDPFGGEVMNPAWKAVKALPDSILDAKIIRLEIPTVFEKSAQIVQQAIEKEQPDVVIHVGQAGGRFCVTPERIAINLDDARIPDNEGNQPIDQVIQAKGPAAYFSTLPVKAMVEAIKKAGLPAAVSNSAGVFVCNHIMYQTLHFIHQKAQNIQAGFIHVPYIPQQVLDKPNQPCMNLADITRSLEKAIEAVIHFQGQSDLKCIGGTIH